MSDKTRYYEICPRGFANEVVVYRVRPKHVAEVEEHYRGYADRHPGASHGWTVEPRRKRQALPWEDSPHYLALRDSQR